MKTKLLLMVMLNIMTFICNAQETKILDNLSHNDIIYLVNIKTDEKNKSFVLEVCKSTTECQESINLTYSIDEETFIKTLETLIKKYSPNIDLFKNDTFHNKGVSIYNKLSIALIGKPKRTLGIFKKTTKPKLYNFNNTDPVTINQKTSGMTNTYEIIYNFKTKVYDRNLLSPKNNHPVVFKIDNINRIAYDIKISSRDSTLTKGVEENQNDKTVPGNTEKKNTIETIEAESIAIEEVEPKNIKLSTDNKLKFNALFDIKKSLLGQLNDSNIEIGKIKNEISQQEVIIKNDTSSDKKNLTDELDKKNKSLDAAEKKLEQLKDDFLKNESELKNIDDKVKKFIEFNKEYQKLYAVFNTISSSIRDINEIITNNNILISIARNPQIYSVDDFNKIARDSISDYTSNTKINSQKALISKYQDNVLLFKETYSKLKNDYEILSVITLEDYKAAIKSMDAMNDNVKKNDIELSKQNPKQIIVNMITWIQYLQNPETYRITSAPIQPNKDLVIFDIDIKTKKGLDYNNERKFSYKEYTKGGVRYDFSTGLVLGLGINDYSFTKQLDTATNLERIIEKRNTNQYLPSIGAMLHVSLRSHKLVSFGLTVGASISTTELDLNSLYPGISVLIGKTEKIIITVGPALKKVQYLKSEFSINKDYPVGTLPDNFETEPAFRQGWFVGLTYNLTNNQKSNYTIVK